MTGLREEIAALQEALKAEQDRCRQAVVASHHTALARLHLRSTIGLCNVLVDGELNTLQLTNPIGVLGKTGLNVPIESLFETDEATDYFEQFRYVRQVLHDLSEEDPDTGWQEVYPAQRQAGFEQWLERPKEHWQRSPALALTQVAPEAIERYLGYPDELVGPDDDFRVEYMACTASVPRDLSLIVGGKLEPAETPKEAFIRPEERGYCFAFGAVNNSVTELQRLFLPVAINETVRVLPGRNHRCLAERVGGILRFSVDGTEVYRYFDPLPVWGAGHGYVSLYSCGEAHSFWGLRVFTRPSHVPSSLRQQIESLRRVVLPTATGRRVEVFLLQENVFLFKDVTQGYTAPSGVS